MSNTEYISTKVTLSKIVEEKIFFNVPIYQRLYVWKQAQINTLLEDLENAFLANDDKYFLGGVMTVRNDNLYDLVDGQQRFTTLWLICNVLKNILHNDTPRTISDFCVSENQKRITFSIREKITEFISKLHFEDTSIGEYSNIPDVSNMMSAIGDIKLFMENEKRQNKLKEFAEFIATKVILVRTEIPENADLNKIFELINGRGQQLSHTDILKSKILDIIRRTIPDDKDKLIRYSQIWDSCSDMSGYIESNIYRQDSKLTWKNLLIDKDDAEDNNTYLKDFNDDFFQKYIETEISQENINSENSSDLLSIINDKGGDNENTANSGIEDRDEVVRSIVSFPMLLLYTLRIFLIQKGLDLYDCERNDINIFNEKKLLLIFKPFLAWLNKNPNEAANFISLLWKFRVAFDKYIVKFVNSDDCNDTILAIKKPRIYKNDKNDTLSVSRSSKEQINDMSQLQSMLYFSQPRIYEHWICPFIYETFKEDDHKNLLAYLQQLDNNLLCLSHDEDMIIRTYNVMNNGLKAASPGDYSSYFIDRISESKGCGFAHYLFYKMDYMLWKINTSDRENRWRNYRITSKNSVEHISAQTPKYDKEKIANCDGFGNLALISSQDNSSYNNKAFTEKRAAYIEKRNNTGSIDSLKSDMIYEYYETWDAIEIENHFNSMEKVATEYFKKTCGEFADTQSENNRYRKWIERNYENNKQTLLQAVFNEDPNLGCQSTFPSLDQLKNMEETKRIFQNNESLIVEPKHKEDFTNDEMNYYLAHYPQAIKLATQDKFKVSLYDGSKRIILLDGVKEGVYNYQELLMVIIACHLEKELIKTTHFTNYCDFRSIHLYLQNNRICRQVDEGEEYEKIYLNIWFDYDTRQMNYQLDFSELVHKTIFCREMKKYGWVKVKNDRKYLYIENRPFLLQFEKNSDYVQIARRTAREIKELFRRLCTIVI